MTGADNRLARLYDAYPEHDEAAEPQAGQPNAVVQENAGYSARDTEGPVDEAEVPEPDRIEKHTEPAAPATTATVVAGAAIAETMRDADTTDQQDDQDEQPEARQEVRAEGTDTLQREEAADAPNETHDNPVETTPEHDLRFDTEGNQLSGVVYEVDLDDRLAETTPRVEAAELQVEAAAPEHVDTPKATPAEAEEVTEHVEPAEAAPAADFFGVFAVGPEGLAEFLATGQQAVVVEQATVPEPTVPAAATHLGGAALREDLGTTQPAADERRPDQVFWEEPEPVLATRPPVPEVTHESAAQATYWEPAATAPAAERYRQAAPDSRLPERRPAAEPTLAQGISNLVRYYSKFLASNWVGLSGALTARMEQRWERRQAARREGPAGEGFQRARQIGDGRLDRQMRRQDRRTRRSRRLGTLPAPRVIPQAADPRLANGQRTRHQQKPFKSYNRETRRD